MCFSQQLFTTELALLVELEILNETELWYVLGKNGHGKSKRGEKVVSFLPNAVLDGCGSPGILRDSSVRV